MVVVYAVDIESVTGSIVGVGNLDLAGLAAVPNNGGIKTSSTIHKLKISRLF